MPAAAAPCRTTGAQINFDGDPHQFCARPHQSLGHRSVKIIDLDCRQGGACCGSGAVRLLRSISGGLSCVPAGLARWAAPQQTHSSSCPPCSGCLRGCCGLQARRHPSPQACAWEFRVALPALPALVLPCCLSPPAKLPSPCLCVLSERLQSPPETAVARCGCSAAPLQVRSCDALWPDWTGARYPCSGRRFVAPLVTGPIRRQCTSISKLRHVVLERIAASSLRARPYPPKVVLPLFWRLVSAYYSANSELRF